MSIREISYRFIELLIVFTIFQTKTEAKIEHSYIDTVYSFTPGTGQNFGQSPEFFPMNIFGAPAKEASEYIPASAESDVLSIGIDGEIIIGVKNKVICNGEGDDFIIFENAFKNQATQKIFAEPAKVAVSWDGINYIEFPHDDWTLEGCAGKTPTNGTIDPFTQDSSGGDGFDIGKLGLEKIRYIKITDISMVVTKDENHPFYSIEAMVTGFDLDAVACKYVKDEEPALVYNEVDYIRTYPNRISINSESDFEIQIFDVQASLIAQIRNRGEYNYSTNDLAAGVYVIKLICGNNSSTKLYLKY
jgi:hypothetical protein